MPVLYTEFSYVVKIKNFDQKIFDIFLIFAQNIDCGYTLEPPRRGGSNEYPHSCEKKPAFLQLLRSFKSFAKASQKPAVLAPAYLL